MKQPMVMTVTLEDGTELQVKVTEQISNPDSGFILLKGHGVEVRVESEEDMNERKSRGC